MEDRMPPVHGCFFTTVAEFDLESGGYFVVIERTWENTGFVRGTDAEALRIVLNHRPQILANQTGAFVLRREDAINLQWELEQLMGRAFEAFDSLLAEKGKPLFHESGGELHHAGEEVPKECMDSPYRPGETRPQASQ
jgi:hypothetical protein